MATNLPFSGNFKVTCEYGRKNTPNLKWDAGYHTGIDLIGVSSTIVYNVCDGTVIMAKSYGAYGNCVKVKDSQTGKIFLFAHLKSIAVQVGQKVTRTSKIGIMGATGNVRGAHLHIEMRTPTDVYGQVENIANYMGIPNKVDNNLNSNNYQLNSNTLKNGDIVEIDLNIGVCCPVNDNFLLCDNFVLRDDRRQFEVHKSVVKNNNRLIARATVCSVEENEILVQVFEGTIGRQFWIPKNCVKLLNRV